MLTSTPDEDILGKVEELGTKVIPKDPIDYDEKEQGNCDEKDELYKFSKVSSRLNSGFRRFALRHNVNP